MTDRTNLSIMVLLLTPLAACAQDSPFVGDWLLMLEQDNRYGRSAYGSLVIEQGAGGLEAFIDGGSVNVIEVDGSQIVFDFDWSDLPDARHLSILEGTLANGVIEGGVTEDGENRGAWRATPNERRNITGLPPEPIDLTGIWGRPAILSKHEFEMTVVGREADERYDPTIDDPILRCVSDGLIRMSHGPFHIEVISQPNKIIVLHEDLHEIRRIYTDGRDFPEGVEYSWLAMGYSIGRWEGSTLVVESRGLKPSVWDAAGMPISSGAVVTERWYLDDADELHVEFSLEDPVNYHRPVEMHGVRRRMLDDTEIPEYSCDPHAFYRSLMLEGRMEEYWSRGENRL